MPIEWGSQRQVIWLEVETELGYFVLKSWITEGIRPGVAACSHHMGRWKPEGHKGQRLGISTVALNQEGSEWSLTPRKGGEPVCFIRS